MSTVIWIPSWWMAILPLFFDIVFAQLPLYSDKISAQISRSDCENEYGSDEYSFGTGYSNNVKGTIKRASWVDRSDESFDNPIVVFERQYRSLVHSSSLSVTSAQKIPDGGYIICGNCYFPTRSSIFCSK